MRWLLLGLMACGGGQDDPAEGPDRASDAVWGVPFDGTDPTVPFLPDQSARYWRYAFAPPGAGLALRIRGDLAGVRYQALDVYDDAERTSVGAYRDELLGDPFELVLGDVPGADAPFPGEAVAVFLRAYDPERVAPELALPRVDVVDADGSSSPPPEPIPIPEIPQALVDLVLAQLEIPQRGDRVDFYNISAEGLYGAADNQYLTAQIFRAPGEVAVVRVVPPTWSGGPSAAPEVRYWSFTQCDRHSFCHHTIADHEVGVAGEPIELVFADDTPELRAAAGDRVFVPWSTPDDEMVLIYRNLATTPGFAGAITQVPLYDFDLPSEGQEAPLFLGDRAPAGVRCALDAFVAGECPAP